MADPSARTPDRGAAFARYYETAHPRVLRAIALVLGDPEHAARIAHESFVRTHAAWKRLGDDDPFLHTLRCAFRLAWRVRLPEVAPGAVADAVQPGGAASSDPRDVDLALALAAMPRAPRVALVFSSFLGLDDGAVAQVMGEQVAEVTAWREQAHASLRSMLGEERTGVA